jgi:hypothetical protein
MKKITLLVFIITFITSCDKDSGSDCWQTAGTTITQEFEVPLFTEIHFEDEISVVLTQSTEQKVIVETGENLLNDIQVYVENERLIMRDLNGCNIARDYGITKVFIEAPNLTKIRNSSTGSITSVGTLNYPELLLVSNTTAGAFYPQKSGDFILNLSCDYFEISANGSSIFYITGSANKSKIVFSDEWPRFEGENFVIDTLQVLHRSATYMKVNPQFSLKGKIIATGDIISVNYPDVVDVEELFTGKLIFQD